MAISGEKTRLHVCHDPRSVTVAAAPGCGGTEIGSLHGARTHGLAVCGRVAIVKTAAAVIVGSVNHIVHALGLIVYGKIAGVVVPEAHARHQICAVCLSSVDGDGSHIGDGQSVELALGRSLEGSRRSLVEVIAVSGLVIDYRDVGNGSLAECILGLGVGISVLRHDAECRAVTLASYLVQRTAVGGRKDACGAVSSDAGISIGLIDVTRALGSLSAGSGQSQKEQGRYQSVFHSVIVLMKVSQTCMKRVLLIIHFVQHMRHQKKKGDPERSP